MSDTGCGNLPSFKAANINILALSDTHGQLRHCARFFDTFSSHKGDIFTLTESSGKKASNLNIFAIAGDWFMNPGTRGVFETCPKKSAGFLQNMFLKKLIEKISQFARTVFVPGNHCLADGDTFLYDIIKEDEMVNILTNVDLSASKAFRNVQPEKFVNSQIIEVPDDKNPSIIRKMLLLGLIPPNMAYYSREAMTNTVMPDNHFKKSSLITKDDIAATAEYLKQTVDNFKKSNPNSPVLIINHSDLNIIKMICNCVDIDYVLQSHIHKTNNETYVNPAGKKTEIFNLSENFNRFGSLKIHFDDEGRFDDRFKLFVTDMQKNRDNEFDELYEELFSKDLKPLIKIEGDGENLSTEEIRYKDNPLSKITTDGISDSLKHDYPDIEIFMMPTSALRKDLVAGEYITNNDIIDLFGGINDHDGAVKIGYLSGAEVIRYVAQNILENIQSPERNTILAVSGICFDRKKAGEFLEKHNITDLSSPSDESLAPLADYIRVSDNEGHYVPVELTSLYKTACPSKLFNKTNVPQFKTAGNYFLQTDKTVLRLFLEYVKRLQETGSSIKIPQDVRIIDD